MKISDQLEQYRVNNGLQKKQLAELLGVPRQTVEDWLVHRTEPGKANIQRIKDFLATKEQEERQKVPEAQRRAHSLLYLLLVVEDEIRWFKDASREARDALRDELNFRDVGYIASLLGMLGEEDQLERWKTLTTYRFSGLRRDKPENGKD